MKTEIKHTWIYNQSPEEVWEYLTKPELMAQWLMPNDFKPIVGHQFQFTSKPMKEINWDGIFYCTVMEIIPFKKLTYTWKGGPGNGKITVDSVVEWTLQAKGEGTELQLVHNGFKEMEDYTIVSMMDAGWLGNIKKIAELLNNAVTNKPS